MKKKWIAIVLVSMCACLFFLPAKPAHAISVVVNGQYLTGLSQEPVMIGDRTYVPMRGVFEQFGTVEWNESQRTVTVSANNVGMHMLVGSDYAMVWDYDNGVAVNHRWIYMGDPSWILNGRVMLPVRVVAETLKAKVEWLQSSQIIYIDTY